MPVSNPESVEEVLLNLGQIRIINVYFQYGLILSV